MIAHPATFAVGLLLLVVGSVVGAGMLIGWIVLAMIGDDADEFGFLALWIDPIAWTAAIVGCVMIGSSIKPSAAPPG